LGPNNHLYGAAYFGGTYQEASDYVRALNTCCGRRGHLASIGKPAENEFIVSLLAPFVRTDSWDPRPFIDFAYIGLNNRANMSEYVWDGTRETVANNGGYVNWCTTDCGGDQTPTADQTFCASMIITTGVWFSFGCDAGAFNHYNLLVFEYDC
jgi:hypothetical protein